MAHSTVWYWLQRAGGLAENMKAQKRERSILVVGKTKIRVQGDWIWIFAAINPENREIVNLLVTKHRESMGSLIFLKRCLKRCEGKPVLITDGGSWYPWATERLGLKHRVVSGGERNYIREMVRDSKGPNPRF